jgi:transcriptional regulator with XRE-family HTH domain
MEKATIQRRLGGVVRARREALKVSQEHFADSIGMHRAYYSSIERGCALNHKMASLLNHKLASP